LKWWPLVHETATTWYAHNCLRLGASLSYYALFSLFPLILVVLAIVRLLLVNSDAARDAILGGLARATGGFRDDFVSALATASETHAATGVLGAITLLLGASWVLGELVSAFNIIWEVEAPTSGGPFAFLRAPVFSIALVLIVAALLLTFMLVSAAVTTFVAFTTTLPGAAIAGGLVQVVLNLGVLTLLFALVFRFVPRTQVAWHDVWLGAGLTALNWTVLQVAITYYIALSSYQDYGAIGAILALVAWVFLSSQVMFLGAEFTAVYARRYGSRVRSSAGVALASAVVEHRPTGVPTTEPTPPQRPTTPPMRPITAGGVGLTLGVIATLLTLGGALGVGLLRILRWLRGR
jgi:membrane protein